MHGQPHIRFTFLVGILGQAYSYNFKSMSLNLNQHVGKPYNEKILTAYLPHSCINIHVTFTVLKLLLIIILGLVYNKYTIPCFSLSNKSMIWFLCIKQTELVFILAFLVQVKCGTSCETWVLNNEDSFCGSRLMTLCHPEEYVVIIVTLLIPSLVGGSMLLLIHLPCHPDCMKS